MIRSAFLLVLLAFPSLAATLLPGFTESTVASGFGAPTSLAVAPDGRVFVATQAGAVRVVQNGVLLGTPALSLSVDSSGERGLIGIALDPNFASNGFVYLHYTVPAGAGGPFNRVARYTMTGNTIDAGSALVLEDMNPLTGATNHNGGAIEFGPDGQLYIAVGENANGSNSQSLANDLGKILRIDPATGAPSAGNPFVGTPGAVGEIWAYGFRNPYQMAFSPDTGALFINDVGQLTWEEINQGVAGGNYGWPAEEGGGPSFLDPVYRYSHSEGCAIVGGAFYGASNQAFGAAYSGDYFFADYCNGWIRSRDAGGAVADFATGAGFGMVDLAVSTGGGLYYLTQAGGGTLNLIDGPFDNVPEPGSWGLVAAACLIALVFRNR